MTRFDDNSQLVKHIILKSKLVSLSHHIYLSIIIKYKCLMNFLLIIISFRKTNFFLSFFTKISKLIKT